MSRDLSGSAPALSVVVPAFNEERRLGPTLDELRALPALIGADVEIVVADDGSTDRTRSVALDAGVSVVSLPHRGKGSAVRAGLSRARGRVRGFCDADSSYGPAAIAALHAAIVAGADVAIASRRADGSTYDVRPPRLRALSGSVFNGIVHLITPLPVRDSQGGLKLFRAGAAEAIFCRQHVDGFAFDVEVLALAARLGFTIAEVPVHCVHSDGSKVAIVVDSMRMLRDVVHVRRELAAS